MESKGSAWTFLGFAVYIFATVLSVTFTADVSVMERVGLLLTCLVNGFLVVFAHQKLTNPPDGDDDEDQATGQGPEDPGQTLH